MAYRNISNGTSLLNRYGPGDSNSYPERGRWMIVVNNSGLTMFLPENSQAERTAIYNNFPNRIVGGHYGIASRLYNNTARVGNGACWTGPGNTGNYNDPPGCPGGWTDAGTVEGSVTDPGNQNPNSLVGRAGNPHANPFWMAWYALGYGCPGNAPYAKWRARYCQIAASGTGYTG
jgi:hypothetical protein